MFTGRDTPSCKCNAGEKVWFWGGAIVLGILVSATGFILDFPNFDQTRADDADRRTCCIPRARSCSC